MTEQSTLYFESHVTIDPVPPGEHREQAQVIALKHGFKLAKLLIEKNKESDLDTFMTAHGVLLSDIAHRTAQLVNQLIDAGFIVRRHKIEDAVIDSRIMDAFGLGVGKQPIRSS